MVDKATLFRSPVRGNLTDSDEAEDSGLPSLAEGQYRPYARPATKPLFSIHFINAKGEVTSFQFAHLDSFSRYTAGRIELRFVGMEPVKVTIVGRNLWRLHDYIHAHRTAWVMETARDFAEDGQPVISKVEFSSLRGDQWAVV